MEIIYLLCGVLFGSLVAWLIGKNKYSGAILAGREELLKKEQDFLQEISKQANNVSVLEERAKYLQEEKQELINAMEQERLKNENLTRSVSVANTNCKNLEEKLANQKKELEELQERFTTEFENIAARLLKQNSNEFSSSNQKNMNEILMPLKEKIQAFEKKIEETYDKELRDTISLKEEVKKLYELNTKISDEANNLTKALKGDVKKQGNWGEIVLERILERSGLTKGVEYEREVTAQNNEGKQIRPDVIIKLPEDKHIIIDSKVSLVAYERCINSNGEGDRERYAKEHIASLKNHVRELSQKHYQSSKSLNAPDFVLMFVPIESSFAIAVQTDQELFGFAWDNKIVIVSPSTLLATMRTIASIWKQEHQNRNVMEIARQGGALYDKFVLFVEDLSKLGKKIEDTRSTYRDSMKKLYEGSGNLVRRAENIRELGATVKKHLPQTLLDRAKEQDSLGE